MNEELVHKILNEKIAKDDKIVKVYIDDVNLSIQDTCDFIEMAKKELKEKGYKIYCSGEKYLFKDKKFIVQNGEVIVAIK